MLSRKEIMESLTRWNQAWDQHDLNGVMGLFHEDILFENWTGAKVQGKQALHAAWKPWFEDHRGFRFTGEDIFIDETEQKVLWQDHPEKHLFQDRHRDRRKKDVPAPGPRLRVFLH